MDCAKFSRLLPQSSRADRLSLLGKSLKGDTCAFDLTPPIRPVGNTIWTRERDLSKSKHTEAQSITALKQVEAGRTAEVRRLREEFRASERGVCGVDGSARAELSR